MDYGLLILAGLAAGIAGGLLGIGGSIITIPAMNELFGLHQHVHQAAAMIVNVFVAVPAVIRHRGAGAVRWPVVRIMAPAAVVCVGLGVWLSELPVFQGGGQAYLSGLFGLFLLYVGGRELLASSRQPDADPGELDRASGGALLTGALTGAIGGLLGVGGGIVCVPLQRRLMDLPLRNAIANSAATMVPLAALGAVLKNYAVMSGGSVEWYRPVVLAIVLIPTAFVGAGFGAHLTHALPIRYVRTAFLVLVFVFAVRMLGRVTGTW